MKKRQAIYPPPPQKKEFRIMIVKMIQKSQKKNGGRD